MYSPALMPPPARAIGGAPTALVISMVCVHWVTACCAEISMCWPHPETLLSNKAIVVASAASSAPCNQPWGTPPTCIGGRSGSPVRPSWPPLASRVRSVASQLLFGPVAPKGDTVTVRREGLAERRLPKSRSLNTPQSRTTSEVLARSSISATPPMTDFFPRFQAQ